MAHSLRDALAHGEALLRARKPTDARAWLQRFAGNVGFDVSPEFHALRAQACAASGDAASALAAIDRAIELRPDWADAHFLRGLMLRDSNRTDEGIAALERSLALRPDNARALAALAALMLRERRLGDAETTARRAIAISQTDRSAWHTLAETLQAIGREGEAFAAWRKWVELCGGSADAHARYGWALARAHRWHEAERELSTAASSSEADATTLARLAFVHRERGDTEAAIDAYRRASTIAPAHLTARVARALLLPQVYESSDAIDLWRRRFGEGLDRLEAELPELLEEPEQLWRLDWSNFYLGYQGRNDVELQRRYSRTIQALAHAAAPDWRDPPADPPERARIRVGFASSFFRTCTVGAYFGPWLSELDRNRFEVIAIYFGGESDSTTEGLRRSVDRFLHVHGDVRRIAGAIRSANLDVLVYPQLGMDGRDVTLGALRLAPIQCVAWGHPDTTGSDQIDCYLSCADMEPADCADHYSERLLLLPGIGTRYALPDVRSASRDEFSLPDHARLYACPHSLFKIHPDNDAMFARLLGQDANARLVLCGEAAEPVTIRFIARLSRTLESHGIATKERVVVQPFRSPVDFRAMLSVCDVMIDTLHWSGGNTSLDALAARLPIVSLPGALMRGRQSAAMLRTIGLHALVVDSTERMVSTAISVASDPGQIRHRIAEARGALFDTPQPIHALERHLSAIVGARH